MEVRARVAVSGDIKAHDVTGQQLNIVTVSLAFLILSASFIFLSICAS